MRWPGSRRRCFRCSAAPTKASRKPTGTRSTRRARKRASSTRPPCTQGPRTASSTASTRSSPRPPRMRGSACRTSWPGTPSDARRVTPTRRLATGRVLLLGALLVGALAGGAPAQTRPEGEMRWALYVTLTPTWFDPGEVSGQLTPFWVLYALHDALVKPMPGNLMSPSLAESWTVSADQRVYEFKLREGLKFHNGDPFTAEDVKFSFHRAK